MKPIINESHEKYLEQQARIEKRRQKIKAAPPAPPATLKAEKEKQSHRQYQEVNRETHENGVPEEPWDLLKQMEGIKFVSGRPQVQETPVPRTRLEFKYPTVSHQQYSALDQHVSPPPILPSLPPKEPPEPLAPRLQTPEQVKPPTPAQTPPPPPPSQETDSRQFAIGCTLCLSSKLTLAYLENGQDLRSVFIPSTLRDRFLKIAEKNTIKNLETCGILCAVLVSP